MRTRIYLNGQPAWSENEPHGHARVQGHGGAAMGFYSGTVLHVGPSTAVRKAAQARRLVRRKAQREARSQ